MLGRERAVVAAARPLARALLDIPLPDERVLGEVHGLIRSLVGLHELLRHPRVSLRLVMTPDRMVVGEAMRTFTYLNLYGFLTDAVVVNRVFPEEVAHGYFGAWREAQGEQLARVESAFAPVPVLRAPYFEQEVLGPERLDRLAEALYAAHDPAAVLHRRLAQELRLDDGRAELRLELPFARRGEVTLKRIGDELVVRVGGQQRAIMLPGALSGLKATSARLADGALVVGFDGG